MHEADFDKSLKQLVVGAARTGMDQDLIVVSLKAAVFEIERGCLMPDMGAVSWGV